MSDELGLMVIPETIRMQLAKRSMDDSQWNTMSNVLFPGAAPASVLLVWDYCAARKLDPFKKPVHIVPMRVKIGNEWKTRDMVLPGIYEYRTTAQRTGEYMGKDKPTYGPMIQIFGVSAPEWCELTVYRWNEKAKAKVPFTVTLLFKETCTTKMVGPEGKKEPKANDRWDRAPQQMLTKCTEAAALREAFPEEIGGMPTAEEIDEYLPDVVDGSVVGSDSEKEAVKPPQVYERVSEAARENLEKAFKLLKLTKAQALVKINEFIKSETADEDAAKLLEWCRDEYARQQGTTRVKTAPNNDKTPAQEQAAATDPAPPVVDAEVEETTTAAADTKPAVAETKPVTAAEIPFAGAPTKPSEKLKKGDFF